MSRKGRRGRASKEKSVAPVTAVVEEQPLAPSPSQALQASEPTQTEEAPPIEAAEAAPVEAAAPAELPTQRPPLETPTAFAQPEAEEPPEADLTSVPPDDASLPPVDIDNHFFDRTSHPSDLMLDAEVRDERSRLKATPTVALRRQQLTRYVKFAVAASSALCLAALVKVAVARSATDDGTKRPVAAAQVAPNAPVAHVEAVVPAAVPAAEQPPAPPVQTAAPAAPEPVAPPPAPEPAASQAPSLAALTVPPASAPAPVDTAAASAAPSPDPPLAALAAPVELDPKAAAKEKNTCRSALERGKLADAIEAGERSVALDPTDAEAWLILGASYQEKGDMKNARRSYKACLEQGKRGPKYECAAMPH